MKPGKFDEQPIPLIVATSCFGICNSTSAFCTAARTPKSPQPGHQSGSTLPLRSAMVVSFGAAISVAIFSLLDHDLVHWDRKRCASAQLLFDCFHNVVGHKGFTVVLADVPIGHETRFAAQVAGELATVVVFDNDGVARTLQDLSDRVAV